jgi:hypothetical protein
MGPTHFNVHFSCLCSIMVNPTPTLTTTIRILTHESTAPNARVCIQHGPSMLNLVPRRQDRILAYMYMQSSTTERLRLTLLTPIPSPMQSQDPDGTTGRKMPPLWRDRQLVYPHPPPTRPRVPRHQAGQPGTSGVSMLWLEGKSDRGHVYTEEEGR